LFRVGRRVSETTWNRPSEAVVLFLRGHTVRTATPVAAVVGTLLSAVNQGAVVVGGDATVGTWLRIAFNYVVPFVVASIGYLSARRAR
jgi:NAD kinase